MKLSEVYIHLTAKVDDEAKNSIGNYLQYNTSRYYREIGYGVGS